MKILIIDDDNNYVNSLMKLLIKLGHKAIGEWDADIIEVIFREFNPDVIFIDYELNENYNGIDIIKRLKEVNLFKGHIFIANSSDQKFNKKLQKAGCKDISEKNTDKILELVNQYEKL